MMVMMMVPISMASVKEFGQKLFTQCPVLTFLPHKTDGWTMAGQPAG